MLECLRWIFQVVLVKIASLSLKVYVKLCVLFHNIPLAVPGGSIKTCLHLIRNRSEGRNALKGGFEDEVYLGLQKFHLELLQGMFQKVILVIFKDNPY